jgi:hypothetical protein
MKDEIIEELWKIKNQIGSETKNNTKALFERLRKIELKPTQHLVNRTSQRKAQHS